MPVLNRLESLTRHVVNDRRRHRRRRHTYDTLVRGTEDQTVVFRGRTINLSRSGTKVAGLPVSVGPTLGQAVRVEFLLIPKDYSKVERRAIITGRIWRIEEREDGMTLAVKFDRFLAK